MAVFSLDKETVENIRELVRLVKDQNLSSIKVGSMSIENLNPPRPEPLSPELLKTLEKLNQPVTDEQILDNPMHGLEFTEPN